MAVPKRRTSKAKRDKRRGQGLPCRGLCVGKSQASWPDLTSSHEQNGHVSYLAPFHGLTGFCGSWHEMWNLIGYVELVTSLHLAVDVL